MSKLFRNFQSTNLSNFWPSYRIQKSKNLVEYGFLNYFHDLVSFWLKKLPNWNKKWSFEISRAKISNMEEKKKKLSPTRFLYYWDLNACKGMSFEQFLRELFKVKGENCTYFQLNWKSYTFDNRSERWITISRAYRKISSLFIGNGSF